MPPTGRPTSSLTDALRRGVSGTRLEFPARRLGQIVVRRRWASSAGFRYDAQTVAVMRRVLCRGRCAVDVGAHDGSLLRWMVRLAPDAHHIAVEPLPAHAARLQRDFPSVDVRRVALSDEPGSATFHHVLSRPAVSSLVEVRSGAGEVEEIPVEVTTLDLLLAGAPRLDFLKIDVEGAELKVLEGGAGVIAAHRPFIAFEHGPGPDGAPGIPEIHGLLSGELGLRISLLEDWLRGRPALSEQEMTAAQTQHDHFFFLAHP
jgi:FkbM family methyltransferase